MRKWPARIGDEEQLDELLSRPPQAVVDLVGRLSGDILILGVAGKMGPTLACMAKRAAEEAGVAVRVIGVSRFSNPHAREWLESRGIETIPCDLLDPVQVRGLPQAPHVVFMAGRKFGTTGDEARTWASNTLMPAYVCERLRESRIVAFSTGCVYPLVPADSGGCTESTRTDPVGDYAQSCLGRERIFQHFSQACGISVCLLRLNYAIDMRYGVLHDIATRVWAGEPVDRTVPTANVIWQGDANAQALLCLEHCASPARILNITGPETVSVEDVARAFGDLYGKPARFTGPPGDQTFLSDASRARELFGPPAAPLDQLVRWTADWVRSGGKSLNKPTHYEVNSGVF